MTTIRGKRFVVYMTRGGRVPGLRALPNRVVIDGREPTDEEIKRGWMVVDPV